MPDRSVSLRFISALALVTVSGLAHVAQAQDDVEWDVTDEHGPTRVVRFTTTEGTWMNLDVSPDGQRIVFDLMGDIYILPIGGGRAERISGGPAFDVQPRFSPDGSTIAFTSDRGGGDNIWLMDADGDNPSQVTDEDFRLLNGAAWTPDGEFLVARKHFTSTRSLGAGEMWMYHRSGGAGIKLTTRKNDQQDAGEPDVSPDGRYVFFSEDLSGGSTFQYNKDPNSQIYVIRRYDRDTGELRNEVTGAGGSVRPRVSPDGQYIAFVRRVRTESVLYLHDRETGAQRPLFDGMSHDQQEAWAIFGPYPNYAWTPDSRNIVFWAQGKIWRIAIDTRQVNPIPFEAVIEQRVTETVRGAVDPAPDRFEAKMIRGAITSPTGEWLVFEAAGHLWKKRLPDGNPQRVTNDRNRFEQEPSFSPDGGRLVYTTWDDEELSRIWTIPILGGTANLLTLPPGYYRTPRFSPDGMQVTYERAAGNAVLGFVHGVETGLYWVNATGGEPNLVVNRGSDPRFDHTGERLYFQTGGGLEKRYNSIELDGSDERTHFTMKYANAVVPSPDGQWIAFTELFNAYIAPFPRVGQPFDLNKDTKAVPISRVTRDAGTDLHWAGDSQRLHWVIGPEYFTRDLSVAFDFVPGAPEELPEPDSTGIRVGLEIESHVPAGRVALTGARLVTMNGEEVMERGTIVVHGNRIEAIGAAGAVAVPADAAVIDVSGSTIVPGIIDVHAHGIHFLEGPAPQQNWAYFANLAYGVTTNHDPSANTGFVFGQSERQRAGAIVGPRVFSTGTILYGADGDFRANINNLEDARSHLRRLQAVGAFSVKSYNQPRREQRQQVLQAARELGMIVVPEGGSTFYTNMSMILDGHTGIEHNVPVAPLYQDVMGVWQQTRVGYTPTLVVNYGGLTGEFWWYEHTNVWEDERLMTFVPRLVVDPRSRRRQMTPEDDYFHIEVARQAKKLVDAGGTVQIGAHGQMQGLAAHWEMWMFVQGGMTPHEALRSATLHGAQYLGMDADLGSLEVGKLADLIVIEGNPLTDIARSTAISHVMVNGRIFEAMTMNEVGNHPQEREPFWWERDAVDERWVWRP